MKLILVRHGETTWNKNQIFRGRKDIKLNKNGIIQAKRIGKCLAKDRIDIIYSSSMVRAVSTAGEIIKYHNINIKVAKELIDFNFGIWEGLSHKKVKENYPRLYHLWQTRPQELKIHNGETISILESRLKNFLDYLIKHHFHQTVVLVSHRVVLKVFILIATKFGIDYFWSIKLDPGSISILEYLSEKKFVLTHLNDIAHLRGYKNQVDF